MGPGGDKVMARHREQFRSHLKLYCTGQSLTECSPAAGRSAPHVGIHQGPLGHTRDHMWNSGPHQTTCGTLGHTRPHVELWATRDHMWTMVNHNSTRDHSKIVSSPGLATNLVVATHPRSVATLLNVQCQLFTREELQNYTKAELA